MSDRRVFEATKISTCFAQWTQELDKITAYHADQERMESSKVKKESDDIKRRVQKRAIEHSILDLQAVAQILCQTRAVLKHAEDATRKRNRDFKKALKEHLDKLSTSTACYSYLTRLKILS
jgi:hypothetical protein